MTALPHQFQPLHLDVSETGDDPRDMPDVLLMILTKREKKAYRDRLYQRTPFCRFCGRKIAKREDATVDHLLPQSRGGLDTPANLALACSQCNGAKGCRTVIEWARDIVRGATPQIAEGGAE
jgi:5-methylcytosine-specific restriction endonuclease McrA